MKKFALTVLAAGALAGTAFAGTPISFERDGITYVGSVTENNGVQFIRGHEVASGRTFALRVDHGAVYGAYNDHQVSFAAPRAVQTASR